MTALLGPLVLCLLIALTATVGSNFSPWPRTVAWLAGFVAGAAIIALVLIPMVPGAK